MEEGALRSGHLRYRAHRPAGRRRGNLLGQPGHLRVRSWQSDGDRADRAGPSRGILQKAERHEDLGVLLGPRLDDADDDEPSLPPSCKREREGTDPGHAERLSDLLPDERRNPPDRPGQIGGNLLFRIERRVIAPHVPSRVQSKETRPPGADDDRVRNPDAPEDVEERGRSCTRPGEDLLDPLRRFIRHRRGRREEAGSARKPGLAGQDHAGGSQGLDVLRHPVAHAEREVHQRGDGARARKHRERGDSESPPPERNRPDEDPPEHLDTLDSQGPHRPGAEGAHRLRQCPDEDDGYRDQPDER